VPETKIIDGHEFEVLSGVMTPCPVAHLVIEASFGESVYDLPIIGTHVIHRPVLFYEVATYLQGLSGYVKELAH
jgi:hypothetical protein